MTGQTPASDLAPKVEERMEKYIHAARRMIVNQFGPEAGHDTVLVTVTLAAAMANIEMSERIRTSQDHIADIIEKKGL